jgi:hypothetical protein
MIETCDENMLCADARVLRKALRFGIAAGARHASRGSKIALSVMNAV